MGRNWYRQAYLLTRQCQHFRLREPMQRFLLYLSAELLQSLHEEPFYLSSSPPLFAVLQHLDVELNCNLRCVCLHSGGTSRWTDNICNLLHANTCICAAELMIFTLNSTQHLFFPPFLLRGEIEFDDNLFSKGLFCFKINLKCIYS